MLVAPSFDAKVRCVGGLVAVRPGDVPGPPLMDSAVTRQAQWRWHAAHAAVEV